MIESLIMAACIYGTQDSCITAASAYYKSSGLEHAITIKEKQLADRHPTAALLVAYTAALTQHQLMVNLGSGKSCAINLYNSTINFRGEW